MYVSPSHTLSWVQVEDDPVWLVEPFDRRIPCVKLDRIHLRRGQQRFQRVDRDQGAVTGPQVRVLLEPGQLGLWVLMEKKLFGDACRRTQQSNGAVLQMRQHPRGHAFVIAKQVELGESGRRIDDPVRIRDLHRRRVDSSGRFPGDFAGRLVCAKSFKGGVAHLSALGPLGEGDFGDQLRAHPTFGARGPL